VSGETSAGPVRPRKIQLERAYRLLNKALEDFYGQKYERAIELCGEALEHLLPGGPDPSASPELRSDRFLKTYVAVLPVREAEGIADVFSFFQSRKARFRFRQGAPLPDRDWWQFIRISREEAEEVLQVTRLALASVERHSAAGG
jgi:hypothetical protein